MKYTRYPVTITGWVELPTDPNDRSEAYGTTIPEECIALDEEADSAWWLTETFHLTGVTVEVDGEQRPADIEKPTP